MLSLAAIQRDVQSVAEAISAALGVDVEITDSDLIRVAGTGEFAGKLGSSLAGQGYVHAHVLSTQEPIVIEEPGHHKLCKTCVRVRGCYATSELCCPIVHRGHVAGVMGLIGRTVAQRSRLLDNARANLAFLERMSDLLSAKIASVEAMMHDGMRRRQLEAVIGAFDEGVVVVDEYGMVTQVNRYALKTFGLTPQLVLGKSLQDVLSGTGLYDALGAGTELRQCRARVREHLGKAVDVVCNTYPVAVEGRPCGAVLTFHRMEDVSRLTYQIWGHENKPTFLDDIVGVSAALASVKEMALRIAPGNSTVLIRGESGTGKGLLARAIHMESKRRDGPFVVVNCSAVPDTLLESELFGYEEGAFTGARKKGKLGRFQLANKGTLFLDEIGDMPLHLQGKLLRALEDRMIEPVGGLESRPIDVRIIAATNRDLDSMVERLEFRRDLFYRLNVVPIWMPPLRERREDIPLLAEVFLNKHHRTVDRQITGFSDEAMKCLLGYHWPGNVRELSNSVEYAMNLERGQVIQASSLPQRMSTDSTIAGDESGTGLAELKDRERDAIVEALERYEGLPRSKEKAAKALGIHVTTLYRKLRRYGIL